MNGDTVHPGQQNSLDALEQAFCIATCLHNAIAVAVVRVGKIRDIANPAGRYQVAEKPWHQTPGWLLYQMPDLAALLQ
ncbi:hypothetical protein, partial [Alcaligenes faecalis]|uniref:hypothetical protein n=1 Tax=Alcaligenes faecalis TaxID=511 RepID=UPI001E3BB762